MYRKKINVAFLLLVLFLLVISIPQTVYGDTFIVCNFTINGVLSNQFYYWHLTTYTTFTTEPPVQNRVPTGNFTEMRVRIGSNTLNGAFNITLRKNGANTALTVTVSTGATGSFTATANVSVTLGDLCNYRSYESASSGTAYGSIVLDFYYPIGCYEAPQLPICSIIGHNTSLVNETVLLFGHLVDETGLSHYAFSHNKTGEWYNDTFKEIEGNPEESDVSYTMVLPSDNRTVIAFKVFFNNTLGNWGISETSYLFGLDEGCPPLIEPPLGIAIIIAVLGIIGLVILVAWRFVLSED